MLKVTTWETTIIPKVCALARSRLSLSWKWDQIRTKLNQIQMLTKYKNGLRLLGNVYLGEHQFLLGVVEACGGLDWTSLDQVVTQLGKSGENIKFVQFLDLQVTRGGMSQCRTRAQVAPQHFATGQEVNNGQQWSTMVNNGQQWSTMVTISWKSKPGWRRQWWPRCRAGWWGEYVAEKIIMNAKQERKFHYNNNNTWVRVVGT